MNLAKAIKFSILTTLTLSATAFSPHKKSTSHRPMNTRLSTHPRWAPTPKKHPQCEDTNSLKYTNVVEVANKYLSDNRQVSVLSSYEILIEAADEATSVINMMGMTKLTSQVPKELSEHERILGDFLNQEHESDNSWKKELEDLHVNQVMNNCRKLI